MTHFVILHCYLPTLTTLGFAVIARTSRALLVAIDCQAGDVFLRGYAWISTYWEFFRIASLRPCGTWTTISNRNGPCPHPSGEYRAQ